jgi:hypothetical protein
MKLYSLVYNDPWMGISPTVFHTLADAIKNLYDSIAEDVKDNAEAVAVWGEPAKDDSILDRMRPLLDDPTPENLDEAYYLGGEWTEKFTGFSASIFVHHLPTEPRGGVAGEYSTQEYLGTEDR